MIEAKNLRYEVLIIPGTKKEIRFQEVEEEFFRREAWLGQDPKVMERKYQRVINDFNLLGDVISMYNQGLNYTEIAKKVGRSRSGVKTYIVGEKMPMHVSLGRARGYQDERIKVILRPGQKHHLSYVCGAKFVVGSIQKEPSLKETRLGLQSRNGEFIKEFTAHLKKATGIELQKRISKSSIKVERGGRNLFQLLNKETNYFTRLPESFLLTPLERREFLKGLYDGIGQVQTSGPSKTKIIAINPEDAILREFIIKTLREQGFTPRERRNKDIVIPTSENERFAKVIGFRIKRKQNMISSIGKKRSSTRIP